MVNVAIYDDDAARIDDLAYELGVSGIGSGAEVIYSMLDFFEAHPGALANFCVGYYEDSPNLLP